MDITKLSLLLDKYYSGDILPEEYHTLLSLFKEDTELPPDLDAERKMFLAIESWQPSEPKDLEKRIRSAMDHRRKKKVNLQKVWYSSSAAAIILILLIIGIHFFKTNSTEEYGQIAMISTSYPILNTQETVDIEDSIDVEQKTYVLSENNTSYFPISDENLEKSAEIIDEALFEVLSNIRLDQKELMKTIEII